ncbi:MAG TPA: hypothetical protein VL494_13500 [Steroidobacteraceae bacterium]|jgi:hypothetical protein|nr:hypothetical protein [Steroidobacteraceae bacterium]
MTSRYSTPPSAEKLESSTRKLTSSLDALERKVGHLPTPVAVRVASVELTDEQRLAFCHELRQRMGVLPDAVAVYEAETKGRLLK